MATQPGSQGLIHRQHFFQKMKATTTTSRVIAIIKAGEVKSQWPDASGSLRVGTRQKSSPISN
jgi:hypothetical protein